MLIWQEKENAKTSRIDPCKGGLRVRDREGDGGVGGFLWKETHTRTYTREREREKKKRERETLKHCSDYNSILTTYIHT